MAKGVFLDRDETLNPDSGYINDPALFSLYPWVAAELKKLKDAGFLLIVVSNQSGLGRGLITWDALTAIHQKLDRLLNESASIQIDHYEICPHQPTDACDCRKPKPKMILDAVQKLGLNLNQSFMIGDRSSDFEAGNRANLRKSFLIEPGNEATFKEAIAEILKTELN